MVLTVLKKISWDDPWENFVKYGQPKEPLIFDRYGNLLHHDLPDPGTFAIIEVMAQLKEKMSVYDAYLKGVEAWFECETNNLSGTCLKWIIQLKKQEIKNLKKGIFDDELTDYLEAAVKGYRRWCISSQDAVVDTPVPD